MIEKFVQGFILYENGPAPSQDGDGKSYQIERFTDDRVIKSLLGLLDFEFDYKKTHNPSNEH